MGFIYFVRHGQAGPRNDYDRLSDLGHRQTTLLGRHLAANGPRFTRVVTGSLRRQRDSAENAFSLLPDRPAITVDPRWNEFDLDSVYENIGPRLARDDAEFDTLYQAYLKDREDPDAAIHCNHAKVDAMVCMAWISGSYECDGESWQAFTGRVKEAAVEAMSLPEGESLAIFTSATPASLAIAHALGLNARETMTFAGELWNSSLTQLIKQDNAWQLGQANSIPHLEEKHLHTTR